MRTMPARRSHFLVFRLKSAKFDLSYSVCVSPTAQLWRTIVALELKRSLYVVCISILIVLGRSLCYLKTKFPSRNSPYAQVVPNLGLAGRFSLLPGALIG